MESMRVDGRDSPVHAAPMPATDSTEIDTEVARLSQQLGRHARLLHLMKAQVADVMPAGVDWATFGVLAQLVKCGATRQADLAGLSLLDPSTVSRYVGQLVRQGLVERRPDPQDGRAVRLVPTEHGQSIVEATMRRRNQAFLSALAGWEAADLRTLTTLLTRFNDDLEAFRQSLGRAGPASRPLPIHRADDATD
jgi:DNA-binding MarR family transcriptional regulator